LSASEVLLRTKRRFLPRSILTCTERSSVDENAAQPVPAPPALAKTEAGQASCRLFRDLTRDGQRHAFTDTDHEAN
jgi:hypothetical protein